MSRFMCERFRLGALCVGLVLAGLVPFGGPHFVRADEGISTPASSMNETSVIVAFGRGHIAEGHYEPVLMIVRLGYDLKNLYPRLHDHTGSLSVYVEPQVNPVIGPENDFEFGVGLGVKYMHPLAGPLSGYVFASVGPHYISVVTEDQENGFIFSDTAGVGLSWFLTEKSALTVEYRFRHMSNADLAKPNGGMDCHFGAVGYSLFF